MLFDYHLTSGSDVDKLIELNFSKVGVNVGSKLYAEGQLVATWDSTAKKWVKVLQSIKVHDSTLYVGDAWTPEDNFDSATDEYGNVVDFSQVTVNGTVDTNTAGQYTINYSYGGMSKDAVIIMKDKKQGQASVLPPTESVIPEAPVKRPSVPALAPAESISKRLTPSQLAADSTNEVKASEAKKLPATGENSTLNGWLMAGGICLIGLSLFGSWKKRNYQHKQRMN